MTVLLDSCTLVWAFADTGKLSKAARTALESSKIHVSVISAYELQLNVSRGKAPSLAALVDDYLALLTKANVEQLPLETEDLLLAARMSEAHKDPFDRMIAAQAIRRDLTVVTKDAAIGTVLMAKVLW